jgi:hypothetical protein
MSYFSVNAGVNFSKNSFSLNYKSRQSEVDAVINLTSFSLPLLFRYTVPGLKWRPFINAGGIYSCHLRNENKIYRASIDQNIVTINDVITGSLVSEHMPGYLSGIGLQHNLSYRKVVSAELRYNQLLRNNSTLNKSHFDILFCFSL